MGSIFQLIAILVGLFLFFVVSGLFLKLSIWLTNVCLSYFYKTTPITNPSIGKASSTILFIYIVMSLLGVTYIFAMRYLLKTPTTVIPNWFVVVEIVRQCFGILAMGFLLSQFLDISFPRGFAVATSNFVLGSLMLGCMLCIDYNMNPSYSSTTLLGYLKSVGNQYLNNSMNLIFIEGI